MTILRNTISFAAILLNCSCLPPLLGQDAKSPVVSGLSANSLEFTPEEQGRRQLSVRSAKEGYQWRLRIPERVFCDEGVLVGHDIYRVHNPVRWTKRDNGSLRYRRDNLDDTPRESLPMRIKYTLQMDPKPYGAGIVLSVQNAGTKTLHNVTGHICLGHLSDPFRDPHYQRTFIRRNQQYLSLGKTQRGTDPIRAHYRVQDRPPIKIFDNPTNRFWGPLSPEIADNGLILTRSREQAHLVALWFEPAGELFQNSDEPNMCIHSDPAFGDLESGSSVEVKGRIIFFNGSLDQFEKDYLPTGSASK